MSWKQSFLIAGALGALGWLGVMILGNPHVRAGLVWALRSWVLPPDSDAGWQQEAG